MLLSRVPERDESSPIESLFFQLTTLPIYTAALVVTPVPVYPASIRLAIAHHSLTLHSLTLRRRMAFCLHHRPIPSIALGCTLFLLRPCPSLPPQDGYPTHPISPPQWIQRDRSALPSLNPSPTGRNKPSHTPPGAIDPSPGSSPAPTPQLPQCSPP